MASADQLKALLDSFVERNDQRFLSVVMQVAAHEARLGHGKLAEELRAAIDQAKSRRGGGRAVVAGADRSAAGGTRGPAGGLVPREPRLGQMVLAEDLEAQVTRVLAGAAPRGANPRTRAGPAAEAAAGRPAGDGQDADGARAGRRAGPAAVPGAARRLDHEEGGGTTWARSGACSTASCR